ncbi:hypothetical protein TNCV_480191 [Trichonephila clavipes]|nr:hypothetical protein TNCV_480191 [Trichonephila clavipes]
MRGALTGQRYVDYILRPHVGPFLNGLPGAIFHKTLIPWIAYFRKMEHPSTRGVANANPGPEENGVAA